MMRWGVEGPNQWHGGLNIADTDDGQATVTVALHTDRADGPGIRAGLGHFTLVTIKHQVEGRSIEPTCLMLSDQVGGCGDREGP